MIGLIILLVAGIYLALWITVVLFSYRISAPLLATSSICTTSGLRVSGHSLSGHLAMLFARMFPDNTDRAVTLNAPDFFSHGNLRLNMIGFTTGADYHSKITQLNAEGNIQCAA